MMVKFGFYALSILMFLSPFLVLYRSVEWQRLIRNYILIFAIWISYIIFISNSAVLNSFGFPPRLPLLVVFPAIFMILFFTSRQAVKKVIEKVPKHLPIYIQAFRIVVEVLIFGAFLDGVFPQRATFEGLNFDIVVGLSAPIFGFLTQRKLIARRGILLWNFVALLILSITVYSFISTYYFSDYIQLGGSQEITSLPYLLLAAVLLPFAIFYHIISIRQNLKKAQ